jgi:hypothetical protein
MNIKIKLTIAGQELEITMEEARELWLALDKILPAPQTQRPYTAPLPHYHQPTPLPFSPPQYPTITYEGGDYYPSLPPNIRPLDK